MSDIAEKIEVEVTGKVIGFRFKDEDIMMPVPDSFLMQRYHQMRIASSGFIYLLKTQKNTTRDF